MDHTKESGPEGIETHDKASERSSSDDDAAKQLLEELETYRDQFSSRQEQLRQFSKDLERCVPVHLISPELRQRLTTVLEERLALLQDRDVSIHDVAVWPGGLLHCDGVPELHIASITHRNLQQALQLFHDVNMAGPLLVQELQVKGLGRIQEAQREDISIHDMWYEDLLPTWYGNGDSDHEDPEDEPDDEDFDSVFDDEVHDNQPDHEAADNQPGDEDSDDKPRELIPVRPRPKKPEGGPELTMAAGMEPPKTPPKQSATLVSNRGRFFTLDEVSAADSSSDFSDTDTEPDGSESGNNAPDGPVSEEANIIQDVEMIGAEGGPQMVDLEVFLATQDEDEDLDDFFEEEIEMSVDRDAFAAAHGTEDFVKVEIENADGSLAQVQFLDDVQGDGKGVTGEGTAPERAVPLPLFPRQTRRVVEEQVLEPVQDMQRHAAEQGHDIAT